MEEEIERLSQSGTSQPTRGSRRVIRIVALAVGLLALVLILFVGGSNALERIDASSGGIPAPAGFPTDFPMYPDARLQSWTWDATSSSGSAMWLSTGSKKQVVAYYNAALARGDWQDRVADVNVSIPQNPFRRMSQPTYGGALKVQTNWLNGVTRIWVEMSPRYWKAAPSPSPSPAS
jgi:hypothetical protein